MLVLLKRKKTPTVSKNKFLVSPLAVQHERGPRNSTIRRQMALLLKESSDLISAYHHQQHHPHPHFRHHHPHSMPATFHHSLSSPPTPSLIHPTPKYPLDLRTSIAVEQPFDAHESAARILFSAINWAKTVPAFVSLSNHDQVKIFSSYNRISTSSLLALLTRRRLARSLHSHRC